VRFPSFGEWGVRCGSQERNGKEGHQMPKRGWLVVFGFVGPTWADPWRTNGLCGLAMSLIENSSAHKEKKDSKEALDIFFCWPKTSRCQDK
jgi:hypothetical protein